MYSVVLMAALTTGAAAPDCHGCHGCHGCWGGCHGCYGCWGGCHGCWGGCYGCWGGCYGGCYGGCFGCWGGCYGGGYVDGYGCWGGYSSWGCAGCMGCVGGVTYPGAIVPGGTVVPGTPPQGEQLPPAKPNKNGDKDTMASPSRAKLVVELPADAKLFIDDMPMKTTSGVRTFNTPALEPGQAYYYIVRIEYVRDGKPMNETRRVIVRAGLTARADFKDLDTDAVRTVQAK
jgi:uncharacterized protein (TIGR03000 family)